MSGSHIRLSSFNEIRGFCRQRSISSCLNSSNHLEGKNEEMTKRKIHD